MREDEGRRALGSGLVGRGTQRRRERDAARLGRSHAAAKGGLASNLSLHTTPRQGSEGVSTEYSLSLALLGSPLSEGAYP